MRKLADLRDPIFSYDCPQTSFVAGLASILDLGGTLTREDVAESAAAQWASWLTSHGIPAGEVFRDGQLVAPPVSAKSDTAAVLDYWPTVGRYVQNAFGEGYKIVIPSNHPPVTSGK